MEKQLFLDWDYLENLPDDTDKAIVALIEPFFEFYQISHEDKDMLKVINEYRAVLAAFFESRAIACDLPDVKEERNISKFANVAFDILAEAKAKVRVDTFEYNKIEYLKLFNKEPVYVFSDTDFATIQTLMNELRDLISKSELITADHKRRLLKRLEAMQAELHKKTSDVDRFWGFIAEAGIAARKFGVDMLPITERCETLGRIVISVVMSHEGIHALPEIVKLLENTK